MSVNVERLLPGLHSDSFGFLDFLGTGKRSYTVDPGSPAAQAIEKTEQYKAALKEAKAWQKAEGAEVNELACQIFALNATANGWIVGQKIEASGNHTPVVPVGYMQSMIDAGRKPVDLEELAAQAAASPVPSASPKPEPVPMPDVEAEAA